LVKLEVKKRTPAANLASAVILARRERFPDLKEGLPHFYHPSTESTRKPADWDEKDTVPLELQVVMNTGWFRFTNVPLGNALLRNPIFRNIFMCQNTSAYLKGTSRAMLQRRSPRVVGRFNGRTLSCAGLGAPGAIPKKPKTM
jgi:hypothetical protein